MYREILLGKKKFFESLIATTTATASQFRLVLFSEAVSCREKVPAPLLVHVPYISLLTGILSFILVDQVHQEEPKKKRIEYSTF